MQKSEAEQIGWNAASRLGVVAAGSAKAVLAGKQALERGGNAADAAVATLLALMITDHLLCSIGGEVPVLVYDARREEVEVLCGQGRAPRSQAAIDWYMQHGIPGGDDIKMAPVPAAVDLCITLLRRHGTITFEQAVGPTLALLDSGDKAWHPRLAVTLRKLVEEEKTAAGGRQEKLRAVADRFYGRNNRNQDIADELEAFYIQKGGFLRKADLAGHTTPIESPVTVTYRGYTICKCGPWTQGPMLCQALRLLEGFDLWGMGHLSADYIHVVTEALKLALADRDEYYADPDFAQVPMAELLSDTYTAMRRPLIDMKRSAQEARPGDPLGMKALKQGPGLFRPGPGGTTTCVVADRWGNVVSATPSANVPGDHVEGGKTGVTYGNRLRSLNTTPGHPNRIEPGKRPRITLTPTMVLKGGKPVLAISVAGGDLQDQVALNLLLDFADFGMRPDAAVTAPRFATAHHQDSFNPDPDRPRTFLRAGSLIVNETVIPDVRAELAARGHRVEVRAGFIGVPVMLRIDQATGVMEAAGDPAANRHAAGIGPTPEA